MHPQPGDGAGPLTNWVATRRADLANRRCAAFTEAGAGDVAIVGGPPDQHSFGARLRTMVAAERPAGLVILGSGAIPLATPADLRAFVAAAGDDRPIALANNRYSADVVAIAHAEALVDIPDLPADNALPRWLAEAGYEVTDLRGRWRLAVDVDGPLELVLLGDQGRLGTDLRPLQARIARFRAVAADPHAELLVSGRTSPATLAWLEWAAAARVRAFVEERGLRAASRLAQETRRVDGEPGDGPVGRHARPPASVLGALLDRDGPASLGEHLANLADAAIIDTRVLLAHRLGPDEAAWPSPEDRYASDLLLTDGIADPWLHVLTASATGAPIPILLGGHSLVGPGVRLLLRPRRTSPWR